MDVELVHESTFLAAVGQFEGFLGNVFEECVCGPRGKQRGQYALITPKNRDVFRSVLLQGREYVDYLPFARTVQLAERYLNNGSPFRSVPQADMQLLQQASWIRNAIAHRTDHAVRVFRQKVTGVSSLPKNRRTPGNFLRLPYRTGPVQTFYEFYTATLRRVASDVVSTWA